MRLRACFLVACLVASMALGSCERREEPWTAPQQPRTPLPARVERPFRVSGPPAVRGIVSHLEGDTLVVDAADPGAQGVPSARVAIGPMTGIWRDPQGVSLERTALRPGQLVAVWLELLVTPTLPIRGAAQTILIEADSASRRPLRPRPAV